MRTTILCMTLFASATAFADVPPTTPTGAPPATPAPATPPAAPSDPAQPPAADASATPAPTPPPTATTPAPAPATTPPPVFMDTKPAAGTVLSSTVDEGGVHASSGAPASRGNPKIAFELSGTGSYSANPYIEYKGWEFETGANKGARLEANLIGIQLAYELSSMGNDQACGPGGCLTGDFGSTTFHSVELGYRFRFSKLGPVRPFVTASLGGVLANSGDWSMQTSKTVYGGSGRAGFGVEYPIAGRFFASATLAYRILVTENPLREPDADKANKVLLGSEVPNGDYAEDTHLVSGYVGFGVEL